MEDKSSLKAVRLKDFEPISREILKLIPRSLAQQKLVIPIAKKNGRITAAVPKGDGMVIPQGLHTVTKCPVDLVLAPLEDIIDFIKKYYPEDSRDMSDVNSVTPQGAGVLTPALPEVLEKLICDGAVNRASEILVENSHNKLRIRFRIRGVLVTHMQDQIPVDQVTFMSEFIQKMGAQKKEAGVRWADWSVMYPYRGDLYFCRFVVSETKDFSLLTIELSPSQSKPFSPHVWGMGPQQERVLENLVRKSQGVILFTGTDNDDITKNIQACAKELATPEKHVISVELNRQLWFSEVEQLYAKGDPDLFSQLLNLSFRHRPDVVVANPLEKKEHFELCLQEGLKGRMVIAQSHSRDTADMFMRLLGMGIEPYLMGSSLLGIVAQKSLRINCPRCQEKDPIHRERVKEMGIPLAMQPPSFYRGKGCEACLNSGFDRDTQIFEVVEMTDELRSRLSLSLKSEEIRAIIKNQGVTTLRQVAIHKAINGQTSLAEVFRVTPS